MPYIDFVNGDSYDEMEELSRSLFGEELDDVETMTRDEMIEFIKKNYYVHITHPLFAEFEYIYSDTDGIVRDECGRVFESWDSLNMWSGANGIRMRTGGSWEIGWYIKE